MIYLAVALLVLAIAAVTVTLTIGFSAGASVSVFVYLWASLSSFGVFDAAGGLDMSRVLNLPWAIYTGSVTAAVVTAVVVTCGSALGLVLLGAQYRPRIREILPARSAPLIVIFAAAGFALLNPAADATDLSTSLALFSRARVETSSTTSL